MATAPVWIDMNDKFLSELAAPERRDGKSYLSLVGKLGEGFAFMNPKRCFTYANAAAERILGVQSGELAGKRLEDFLHEEDRAIFLSNLKLRESGEESTYELKIHTVAGEKRYVLITGTPQYDSQGVYEGSIGVFRDITQRREMESALRESESRYHSLFDNMLEGFARCRVIYDGERAVDFVYLEVNAAFEKLTGLNHVVGRKVSEVIPRIQITNPELLETYGRVARAGHPEKLESHVASMGIWFSIAVYSDQKEHFVAIFENITGRKKVEWERGQKNAFLEAIISSSPDGIMVLDTMGRRIVQNSKFNELLKIPDELVKDPDDAKQLPYVANSTLQPEEFYKNSVYLVSHPSENFQSEIEFKDGRVLDRNSSGVFGGKGEYLGRIWIYRDVTEHKRMTEAMKQSERKFRALFENARDIKFIINTQGQVLNANLQACEQLQYSHEEILRLNVRDIDSPENADLVAKRIQQQLEQGHIIFETSIRRKDGSILPVEINSQLLKIDGKQLIFATCRDLTERQRAETDLRRISNRLLMATRAANVGIWELDLVTGRVVWDDEMSRLYGITPDKTAISHETWKNCVHPDDIARAEDSLQFALHSGKGIDTEFRVVWPDKSIHHIKAMAVAERDASGKTLRMVGTNWDITERKRAEEKLLWQSSALKTAANAIVIVSRDGSIVFANRAFSSLTGYSLEEVLGKNPRILKSGAHNADFYNNLWDTILSGFVWRGEIKNRRKDGTLYDEEMTITPVRDKTGGITHFIAIKQDITERRRAEDLLHEMARQETGRQKSRIAMELGAIAIFGAAYIGFMAYTNWLQKPADLFAARYQGRLDDVFDILCVVLAGFSIFAYRRWKEVKDRVKQQFQIEKALRTLHAELETRVQQRTSELSTANKSLQNEIAERKQAENLWHEAELQLRQAQKLEAVGQLAAGIAHEINTPTQYVGDNTRFLQESFKSIATVLRNHMDVLVAAKENKLTPEMLKGADEILAASDMEYLFAQIPSAISESLEGVERVTKIVRAMKEFSHPGGRQKAAEDLNKAIESTVTVARNEWKYFSEMKLDFTHKLPYVPCFIGEFNQCILNLVINAAHAVRDVVLQNPNKKGLITVSTRLDGGFAEVRVSDTGTGIPEIYRSRIFEPFFTTKPLGQGTGQGLAMVYSTIVQKHGGTVSFETETGKGTTFIIRLPVAPSSARPDQPPTQPPPAA